MGLKRDLRGVDTTYGLKQDEVYPYYELRSETIAHGNAAVNGAATLRTANKKRMSIKIHNRGGIEVFVGTSGVVGTDGFPILPNEFKEFKTTAAIYIYSAAACDVRFFEELLGADA